MTTNETRVRRATKNAKAIIFDGCHKIYLLMDDEQVEESRNYPHVISAHDVSPQQMFEQVKEWYRESCGLRFVDAVTTTLPNPNDGYEDLVPQGEGWYGKVRT